MKIETPTLRTCLALLALWTATLAPAAAYAGLAEDLERLLATSYEADEPGAAMIVVDDGEVVYRGARGMADLELGVPLEPDMVFRLGSITKQFTCAAILLLEEQGKLSVADPITEHLPGYPVHGHTITVEHLMTHTSGIFSYTSIPGYMDQEIRKDLTTAQLVDAFKSQEMDFAPGERWSYSNSGYVLLGAIIEKVSGVSYAEFLRVNVFEPLGMKSTHYGGPQLIPRRAAGYGRNDDGTYVNARYLSMTQPHAAGSLLSTVDDLARWDAALYGDELLSEASRRRMFTAAKLNSGEATTYGYGFAVGDLRGVPAVFHGGGIFGFTTYGIRVPDERVYVAVLSNGAPVDPGLVARKAAAIAVGKPFPEWRRIEVDPEILGRYVGVYRIDESTTRTVTVEDGRLYTMRSGSQRLEALPHSETGFFYEGSLTHFVFVRDDQGKVTHMLMYPEGADEPEKAVLTDEPIERRSAVEVDASLLDRYVGRYELSPSFAITVTREGGQLFVQATGQPRFEVFPESETKFFLKVVDAQVTFVTGAEGRAEALILHQGGIDQRGERVD